MKKKLALVLAGVMTMTMLPMNLFANSENTVTKVSMTGVPEGTVFYSPSAPVTGEVTNGGDMTYRVDGGYLKILPKEELGVSDSLTLKLENAEWFFRDNDSALKVPVATDLAATTDTTLTASLSGLLAGNFTNQDTRDWVAATTSERTFPTGDTWYMAKTSAAENALQGYVGVYHHPKTAASQGFYLYVSALDAKVALLKLESTMSTDGATTVGALADKAILIPLSSITTDEDVDVKVKVDTSLSTGFTGGTLTYAYGVGGATNASATDIRTSRDDLNLYDVVLQETRPSSLKNGTFFYEAPEGYTFAADADGVVGKVSFQNITGSVEGTAKLKNAKTKTEDDTIVEVTIKGMTTTSTLRGSVYVSGLVLVADDDSVWGDAKLTVKDGTLDITEQSFLVGTRVDYGMSFQVKDNAKVPSLVSGRYEINDKTKTARVVFKENAVNSWWGTRETSFALPSGVKFRQIEVLTADKLNIRKQVYDGNTKVTPPALSGTSRTDADTNYYATVDLDGGTLTFKSVAIKAGNNKAKLEFDAWLSIRADFEGDVTLTPSGSMEHDKTPLVIATAIAPVSIDTKVTDIKIGYQYQNTADIILTENIAGALIKGNEVNLMISDLISNTDIVLSPSSTVTVSKGNLKVKDVTVFESGNFESKDGIGSGSGKINFTIDRASTTASELTISNVSVKVNRSVPESNIRPYKVYAYGSAIAPNFANSEKLSKDYGKEGIGFTAVSDTVNSAGVASDYVRIVSAANDKTSVLTQEVRVTMGANTYTVGNKEVDMAAAAYISTKSNSTMVPLRFVGNAFGLSDDQIVWSQVAKTATLIHPSRTVQFTADSDKMLVNGASIEMVTNGTKVFAEFNAQGDGRMYVPFRALGSAFGIDVAWDAETSTAIYNPAAAK